MDQKSMQEELRAAEAALGAAVAARRQAEVDVDDGRRKVALETKAVADGVSPRTALEEAQFGLKRAQAAAERAASTVAAESSHVQTARDHVSDLALRAPTAGTVAMRFKDPGATVPAGGAILRIVGRGGLRLRFAVPPEEAHSFALGVAVHATIETIAAPIDATIKQVSPALDQASGMIIIEAELSPDPATAALLRPGLAARVR
jgi:biotin carboxyl carrier protein